MKIIKFGGTSVANADKIQNIIKIVRDILDQGDDLAVVCSAFGGVTDILLDSAKLACQRDKSYLDNLEKIKIRHLEATELLVKDELKDELMTIFDERSQCLKDALTGIYLLRELSPKSFDFIASFGEQFSNLIISYAFRSLDIEAEYLDARDLVRTDSNFMSARVDFITTNANIQQYFKDPRVLQVITGFIGYNEFEQTTTLGRGGSDYTASIFGAALDVEEIQIWTDVDGVFTADPRKVKDAFAIREMTYEEAMEMSHFGAKVIHPPTMQPAREKQIPIRIKSTFEPQGEGTLISSQIPDNQYSITGISSVKNIAMLQVQGSGLIGIVGISGRLFSALAKEEINIVLIVQSSSEHSICFAITPSDVSKAQTAIEKEFKLEMQLKMIDQIEIDDSLSVLAIVGEKMRHSPGVSAKLFMALGSVGVNVVAIAQGLSERNISVVIEEDQVCEALQAVHQEFFK